jgi:hypothetical protein
VANIAPSDHALAQAILSPAPAHNSDSALAALNQLVEEFASPEQVHQLTQYLLQPERDVYLGYLRPSTIQ